jgi:hypothetical protein
LQLFFCPEPVLLRVTILLLPLQPQVVGQHLNLFAGRSLRYRTCNFGDVLHACRHADPPFLPNTWADVEMRLSAEAHTARKTMVVKERPDVELDTSDISHGPSCDGIVDLLLETAGQRRGVGSNDWSRY